MPPYCRLLLTIGKSGLYVKEMLFSGFSFAIYSTSVYKSLVPITKGGLMASPVKIMPCLDMKNGRVVKGIHFVELKDAGDPVENAAFYQKEGADELAMLDIAATLENRKTRLEWVRNVSAVINIPLTRG